MLESQLPSLATSCTQLKPPSRQKRRARSNRSVPGPQHQGEDQHRGEEQLSDRPGSSESSDEERAEQKETPTKGPSSLPTDPKASLQSLSFSTSFLSLVAVGDDMLPLIEREFPHIHVSPATLRRLWQRQLQQIMALSKPQTHQLGSVKQASAGGGGGGGGGCQLVYDTTDVPSMIHGRLLTWNGDTKLCCRPSGRSWTTLGEW